MSVVRQTETTLCGTACCNQEDATSASLKTGRPPGPRGHTQMCPGHSGGGGMREGKRWKGVNHMGGLARGAARTHVGTRVDACVPASAHACARGPCATVFMF